MKDLQQKTQTLTTFDDNNNIINEEEVKTFTKIQKRHFKKGGFFTVNRTLPKFLLKQNYNSLTYKLLFLLLDRIDFNNRITTFRQSELAEEIGSNQSNISRSLKTLEDDEIISKNGHDYYFTEKFIKYAGDN